MQKKGTRNLHSTGISSILGCTHHKVKHHSVVRKESIGERTTFRRTTVDLTIFWRLLSFDQPEWRVFIKYPGYSLDIPKSPDITNKNNQTIELKLDPFYKILMSSFWKDQVDPQQINFRPEQSFLKEDNNISTLSRIQ